MAKALWKYYWYLGRQGIVEGLFVEDEDEVNLCIGREVYFGEILGKHSEVYGELKSEHLKKLTEDPVIVDFFEQQMHSFGYNPISAIRDNEEDEDGIDLDDE